jgi:hypothetical protein
MVCWGRVTPATAPPRDHRDKVATTSEYASEFSHEWLQSIEGMGPALAWGWDGDGRPQVAPGMG